MKKPAANPPTTMTYEEWKARRVERVPGRCGGRPVFIKSRLQPCDVHHLSVHDMGYKRTLASWGVSAEDVEYSKRFCAEEPHWEMLARGYDRLQRRQITDEEYEALRAKWKLEWPPKAR